MNKWFTITFKGVAEIITPTKLPHFRHPFNQLKASHRVFYPYEMIHSVFSFDDWQFIKKLAKLYYSKLKL